MQLYAVWYGHKLRFFFRILMFHTVTPSCHFSTEVSNTIDTSIRMATLRVVIRCKGPTHACIQLTAQSSV